MFVKEDVRRELLSSWIDIEQGELREKSIAICNNVVGLLERIATQKSIVGGYFPIKNEIDITHVLNYCLELTGSVCLPIVEKGSMSFGEIRTSSLKQMKEFLVPCKEFRALMQPNTNLIKSPDILCIPAVAFASGFRLGRGGGYYDKFLSSNNPVKIGVSLLKFADVEKGWVESHDARMDYIVHEEGIMDYYCTKQLTQTRHKGN